ncbi:MAG TPA: GNAT family N-acetyltransferase [Thermoanaerobaculia bacterium]|nr:GNAT family N-acetyltransferase [Thermoanaerobaculia bacterium]
MKIRRAAIEDSDELTQLAHESKSHWGYPERWIELWRDDLTLDPELIAGNEYYLAEDDGQVLGCFGLIPGDPFWVLEDFWVRPAAMGRGVGRALFEHARKVAAEAGATVVEIDADPNAEPFYLRMGARRVGEVRTEVDGQPRIRPLLHLEVSAV